MRRQICRTGRLPPPVGGDDLGAQGTRRARHPLRRARRRREGVTKCIGGDGSLRARRENPGTQNGLSSRSSASTIDGAHRPPHQTFFGRSSAKRWSCAGLSPRGTVYKTRQATKSDACFAQDHYTLLRARPRRGDGDDPSYGSAAGRVPSSEHGESGWYFNYHSSRLRVGGDAVPLAMRPRADEVNLV